jgi:hypothetical protein
VASCWKEPVCPHFSWNNQQSDQQKPSEMSRISKALQGKLQKERVSGDLYCREAADCAVMLFEFSYITSQPHL